MATAANYAHVFTRLAGLRPGGDGKWSACCPSHDDHHQSLSIRVGDNGALLMKCHAPHGCTLASVVAAINLTMDDLFPDNKRNNTNANGVRRMSDRTFVCAYDYRDHANKLVYQAVRWNPKGFNQRRVNPYYNPKIARHSETNPEYLYNLDGVERILYRLPQLLKAIRENPVRWIFVMEGEKDVDLAWKNGIVATCNPMGALKWDEKYSFVLKNCNVVVIPDEDPVDEKVGYSPGLRHAEMVCDSLRPHSKTQRVLRLPGVGPKGDFSEWWELLGSQGVSELDRRKKLAALATEASEWMPRDVLTPVYGGMPNHAGHGAVTHDFRPGAQDSTPDDIPGVIFPTKEQYERCKSLAGDGVCLFRIGAMYHCCGRDNILIQAACNMNASLWPSERLAEVVHKMQNANLCVAVFEAWEDEKALPIIHEASASKRPKPPTPTPPTTAVPQETPTATKEWEGEITPGLQAIANVAIEMRESLPPQGGVNQLAAKLLVEIGCVSNIIHLSPTVDKRRLRDTLAAIGSLALIGLDDLAKA